jgi:hypothetical protein
MQTRPAAHLETAGPERSVACCFALGIEPTPPGPGPHSPASRPGDARPQPDAARQPAGPGFAR